MIGLNDIRHDFLENLSRIAEFWGYPRAMGALYGALYLSPGALSLDELVSLVGVTKGAVSTNIRTLEQLGMVHRQVRPSDRRDYYVVDSDFWRIVKTFLERRQKPEFDRALSGVSAALEQVRSMPTPQPEPELARLYENRLAAMQNFFHTLDGLVSTMLQIEKLRVQGLKALLPIPAKRKDRK